MEADYKQAKQEMIRKHKSIINNMEIEQKKLERLKIQETCNELNTCYVGTKVGHAATSSPQRTITPYTWKQTNNKLLASPSQMVDTINNIELQSFASSKAPSTVNSDLISAPCDIPVTTRNKM